MDVPPPQTAEALGLPKLPLGSYRLGNDIVSPDSDEWGKNLSEPELGRWMAVAGAMARRNELPAAQKLFQAIQSACTQWHGTQPWAYKVKVAAKMTEGEALVSLRKFPEATANFKEAIADASANKDLKIEATATVCLAGVAQDTGLPVPEIQSLYDKGLNLANKLGSQPLIGATKAKMAAWKQATGQGRAALTLYEEALQAIQEAGELSGCAAIISEIAKVHESLGEPAKAVARLRTLMAIVKGGSVGGDQETLEKIKADIRRLEGVTTGNVMPSDVD